MILKGLFTQIAMVAGAIAIIITYIVPEFDNIAKVQDSINVYKSERDQVIKVNDDLASLVTKMTSVSIDDQDRMKKYLPDSIDEIRVLRDLFLISEEGKVLYISAVYEGEGEMTTSVGSDLLPIPHSFSLTIEGSYDQIKNLFSLLEQNNYPLDVYGFNVVQLDGNLLSAVIQLTTYTYHEPGTANNIKF